MKRRIIIHDEARYDVLDIAYYIAENSLDASDRFIDSVSAAYHQLTEMPGIGVVRDYQNPKLEGMRMWSVPRFPKHLIFYSATETELRIIRVLHGARDIESIFKLEEEDE